MLHILLSTSQTLILIRKRQSSGLLGCMRIERDVTSVSLMMLNMWPVFDIIKVVTGAKKSSLRYDACGSNRTYTARFYDCAVFKHLQQHSIIDNYGYRK